jgi:molybdenum cofactor guanylyltransferase
MNLSAAVLAGGRSSRFGTDKAGFVWQGKTLLDWALSSFFGLTDVMIIGGSRATITDTEPFLGALHGLQTALVHSKHPRVAVMACDMPNLTSGYWRMLEQFNADVVIPENADGQLEPLAAIYSRLCLPLVQSAIAKGDLKLTNWWGNAKVRIVKWTELEAHFSTNIFLNANRLEDLGLRSDL